MADLPSAPGVYALVLLLEGPLRVEVMGRAWLLEPGCYVYVGSARGPGGLRARVSRHLRRGKRLRWHVDRLTEAARVEYVVYALAGRECDLVPPLEGLGFRHPIPGFGASDCRQGCSSHLLSCPCGLAECLRAVEAAFRAAGLEPESVAVSEPKGQLLPTAP